MADPHDKARRDSDLFYYSCGQTIRLWVQVEHMLIRYMQIFLAMGDDFRARIIWYSLPNWDARRKLLHRLAETSFSG